MYVQWQLKFFIAMINNCHFTLVSVLNEGWLNHKLANHYLIMGSGTISSFTIRGYLTDIHGAN